MPDRYFSMDVRSGKLRFLCCNMRRLHAQMLVKYLQPIVLAHIPLCVSLDWLQPAEGGSTRRQAHGSQDGASIGELSTAGHHYMKAS